MRFPTACFGDHFARHEQAELDADTGEANPLPARFAARGDVVVAPQHSAPIVDDGKRRVGRVRNQPQPRRPRVERVGNRFGQNGFFERAGVGITKVFEQVLEIDARLTHLGILLDTHIVTIAAPLSHQPRSPGQFPHRSSGEQDHSGDQRE